MEIARQTELTNDNTFSGARAANDNSAPPLSMGRSVFPDGVAALIYRDSRSVTTSGPAPTRWKLAFERRSPSFIEPLMGYTGARDTLTQIDLSFPTLESAVRYAQRQGLSYTVRSGEPIQVTPVPREVRSFSDNTLERLGLSLLSESYGRAMNEAANRNEAQGNWPTPMAVVADTHLSLDAKRSILMNWAWNEFLIDQATNEGMPENGRPSRLDEVEQALLALERRSVVAEAAGVFHRAA